MHYEEKVVSQPWNTHSLPTKVSLINITMKMVREKTRQLTLKVSPPQQQVVEDVTAQNIWV